MTRSDAEELLNKWTKADGKVFYYRDYGWFDTEVIVIFKVSDELYTVDKARSTVYDGPFDRDHMISLLIKDLLIHRDYVNIDKNFREERNGGCTCGAWRTRDPNNHSRICKKFGGF